MPKFLIIRFSSIGDIVLTTPVIRCLKEQVKDAEVHYCSKPGFKGFLDTNPYIDKLHLLDGDLNTLVKQLQQEKFDYVIDLHNNLRTRVIKLRLGVKSYSFDKLNFKKWLLVQFKKNTLPPTHIVDRYLDTLKKFNIVNDNKGLDYFIPEKDKVERSSLPEAFRNTYVAVAIGAQHFTKRLPNDRLVELCERIQKPVVLLGGKEDAANGDLIAEACKAKGLQVFNACGKYNLNQSASLLEQSEKVFSHDTGLMHIAAALKKEIWSIWGNTVPEFGMYPYQTKYHILENKGLDCRPCSKIGYQACPKGHFKCMKELDLKI